MDKLRAINDELRSRGDEPDGPWLPLESNPDVFTTFSKRCGLPKEWIWQDVLGLDPELLSMIPPTVAAAILLFPCTENIYAERAKERENLRGEVPTEAANSCFFLEQISSFGNACGTIACVHSLANVNLGGSMEKGPIAEFCDETANQTPEERGQSLLATAYLKNVSDDAAEDSAAQTTCPDRNGPDLDHHYCAFVPVDTADGKCHIVELDGTKHGPIDHGEVTSFLEGVAAVIREKFMAIEPERFDFSLMVLCRPK